MNNSLWEINMALTIWGVNINCVTIIFPDKTCKNVINIFHKIDWLTFAGINHAEIGCKYVLL